MKSSLAIVETDQIGNSVSIAEYTVIRKNVVIGDDVIIHPFVVIEEGVRIGNGVEIFPGTYIGKTPKGVGATARVIHFNKFLAMGDNCAIGPNAVVFYDVEIGNNTLIGDGASIREGCRIGSRCIIGRHVTLNYATIIGDGVKVMDHTWLAGNMSVGDRVFISGGVLTTNDNDMGLGGFRDGEMIGPKIEAGARIGAGAILLPNITVGANSVVAAGAIVTKDIAPYDLSMGVPARVVRRLPQHNGAGESE